MLLYWRIHRSFGLGIIGVSDDVPVAIATVPVDNKYGVSSTCAAANLRYVSTTNVLPGVSHYTS